MTRQTYSIDQIKNMLLDRLGDVVYHYAPPASGSYTHHGLYFTLNPGRADRSVGSFCIHMGGAKAGRWIDYAMAPRGGERTSCASGDVLDLIGLSLGLSDPGEILKEARAFLGLETISPEVRRQRERSAAEAKRRREDQARRDALEAEKRARRAQALWLEASPELRGTPVDHYLRDARGIDLSALGRAPGVLRFHPACWYQHTDKETGEVIEGRFPAMLAAVCDRKGGFAAVHRTYLGRGRGGAWGKADLPEPKKVMGDYRGAAINIWRGTGPRGGKPASLPQCPPGSHVFIAEGIEDALSVVVLRPAVRVIAAISLSNMGGVELPRNVARVTLVADLDEHEQAQKALARAVELHRKAGREVRLFQNRWGGKDLNDALRQALEAEREKEDADD
ncbi:Toprim domain-containing protein [Mameliella alba]|uniref:DUF7146 domain-containing protein n=1 Tax=Mameliella alba TaxID=561184 RepID=UPI000891918C|nr:toprim domain-containing protein [Mameliella alba]OWV46472.1 hypothetical protein CDZ96_17825 [Mameliella alba]PTR37281.1 Toprim domain-containing protein [Mameliella alba]GGF73523.1 hypothetical protein GCM10011319_37520 [Mameliella alba]SDD77016.1 Toprim domain-containing protein [Mameliella alba]